jgi:ferritin-like metal-binding protein YciE
MPKINTLHDVYVDQLIKALPKMAKAAHDQTLKKGFEEHLEQTKGHAERLEEIFEDLDEKPTGKKCKAMAGLIEEGSEAIGEDATPAAKDAMLIACAQRVEHYEIAGYGCVKTYARLLGFKDAAKLLEKTLGEEAATDEKLTEAAESINVEAENTKEGEESSSNATGRRR